MRRLFCKLSRRLVGLCDYISRGKSLLVLAFPAWGQGEGDPILERNGCVVDYSKAMPASDKIGWLLHVFLC